MSPASRRHLFITLSSLFVFALCAGSLLLSSLSALFYYETSYI